MRIDEIDTNFKPISIAEDGFDWYDAAKLELYGVKYTTDGFMRLPASVAKKVSDGVAQLCSNTAGGRVRFYTQSPEIAIKVEYSDIFRLPHMSLSGTAGFSLVADYDDEQSRIAATFIPPIDVKSEYTSSVKLHESFADCTGFTLYLPLYASVKSFFIGVKSGYSVTSGKTYSDLAPVLFYGSSITQGACACVAGTDYVSLLSQWLNIDVINFGFSGNAKGEDVMADYIAEQNVSAFVYDYDHNAPSVEHYEKTHSRFFRTFREAHPTTPIIIMTRPDRKTFTIEEGRKRHEIAYKTYSDAVRSGDENVYFIDGKTLVQGKGGEDACFVDGCHPNNLGFFRMACIVEPILRKALKID